MTRATEAPSAASAAPLGQSNPQAGASGRLAFALCVAVLATVTFLGWMAGTGRSSLADLAAPVVYSGDGLGVLAQTKAYSAGEIVPFMPKRVASLGAPYGANWTDYPAEDLLYFTASLFARVFGLIPGTTLFVLCLHVLAGVSFFVAGTALGYRRPITLAAAILFALAPYGFVRHLSHLTLTAYWHVPLMLFSFVWAAGAVDFAGPTANARYHRALAAFGAACAGLLNPYYLAAFLLLVASVGAGAIAARNRRNTIAAATVLLIAATAFGIQSLDSLWVNLTHGSNPAAVQRSLPGLERWGLRLPDLAFPIFHRWTAYQAWADATYQNLAPFGRSRGEAMTAYIGIVGCAALIMLLAIGTIRVAAKRFERVSIWYWAALMLIAFAVVGGINYFLGALGFVMLRATNRLSIILLAIALFWICESVSRKPGNTGLAVAVAAAMVSLGLWDQIPPPGALTRVEVWRAIAESDSVFVRDLEDALPGGAMVLQLPLKKFPETGMIHRMDDYEHFRPYLYSKQLRFSYGTIKGRSDSDWQAPLVSLAPPDLVARAADLGFVAVHLNRKAYPDNAQQLEAHLTRLLGYPIANSDQLVAFRISNTRGKSGAFTPPPQVEYRGFSSLEVGGGHAWTWALEQSASVIVRRAAPGSSEPPLSGLQMRFGLESGNGGSITVEMDGRRLDEAAPPGKDITVLLPPGRNEWRLEFHSGQAPREPGNGDPRRISFRIRDLRIREAAAS